MGYMEKHTGTQSFGEYSSLLFSYIFNMYDMFVLATGFVAMLLILPLMLKRDRSNADYTLSGFLLGQGVVAIYTVFYYNKNLNADTIEFFYPFHFAPFFIIYGTQGILLYWCSKAMMGENPNFLSKKSLSVACVLFLSIASNIWMDKDPYAKNYGISLVILASMSVYFGIVAIRQMQRFDTQIKATYSNVDKLKLDWMRYCATGFVLVWIIGLICFFCGILGYSQVASKLGTVNNIPPLILVTCMVVFSQSVANIAEVTLPLEHENTKDSTWEESPEIIEQLNNLMLNIKVYQDPDLRLEGLADSLGVSERRVSMIINRHHNKNFYDFVNEYRVMDAAEQLKRHDAKSKTIQRVFEDAGFNSKSTFNTLFKKITGQTPSDFRKSSNQSVCVN